MLFYKEQGISLSFHDLHMSISPSVSERVAVEASPNAGVCPQAMFPKIPSITFYRPPNHNVTYLSVSISDSFLPYLYILSFTCLIPSLKSCLTPPFLPFFCLTLSLVLVLLPLQHHLSSPIFISPHHSLSNFSLPLVRILA